MKKKYFLFMGLILFNISPVFSQDTLFFEDFNDYPGAKPPGWTSELEVAPNRIWQFVDGGGTQFPSIPGSRRPPAAYSGMVNALYFYESLGNESVILITPPINLEFAVQSELRFHLAMMTWHSTTFGSHNDELRIYYKTHIDSSWVESRKIAQFTDAVESWTEQTILIPEGAFSPTCYFAFKATTKRGWGVCIDDVTFVETGELPRYVDGVTISQESTDLIPSGAKNNPVLQVDVKVKGNTGDLPFNSIEVKSLCTSDNDIPTGGVKLFYNTNSKDFYASVPYATTSFSGGKATFTGLNLNLKTGYTSFWVTVDVKSDATHLDIVDMAIESDKININSNTYPATETSPPGTRTIHKTVFFDDFSADKGWVLAGDFQRNRPRGLGGTYIGNTDPKNAAGDTMIIGNDLTGLGFLPGDYEPNVARYVNLATSPVVDLLYYNNVKLIFLRWLNVENADTSSIELSVDNGSTWNEVWTNDNNLVTDNQWTMFSMNLPAAKRKSAVKIRFNLGPTTLNNHFSGWNIENFAIAGNYVEHDVGPVALLTPGTGCGNTSAETVSVRVRNFGPTATPASIPIKYSFDGGTTFVSEILTGPIPFDGEVTYNFTTKVNLSVPGTYNVIIQTALDVDEEESNNTLDTTLYVDPTYPVPYQQNFEGGRDFWRGRGTNSSWEYGTPVGSVISSASSGTRAWVTQLAGNYNDEEDSWLTGPCFDFTGIDFPVFESMIFTHMENDTDGVNLEYSLNNGISWSRIGNKGDGDAYGWNWYNSDAITALSGNHGWTGEVPGWRKARILLDPVTFSNQASVKFRFHFASDTSTTLEGIGIDDIKIYDAPRDAGVILIDSPVTACAQDVTDHVKITIRNFGLDTLMAGDTIIAGYDYESEPTVTESFQLPANVLKDGTFQYTFKKIFTAGSSGVKNITSFTLLPDDNRFYNEMFTNDSASKSFEVLETPFADLPRAIYTVRPDTVILNAYTGNPVDTYLWQDSSTDSVFHVSLKADGIYDVEISNGVCSYRDTTYIYRLIADAGATGLVYPSSDCELGDAVLPQITITNFGTDTLLAGDEITAGYQVDSDPAVEEIAVLDSVVYPGGTYDFTFTIPVDMSAIGTYAMKAYTRLTDDETPANDTTNTNVTVYGITPIDLGPRVVVRALDYTIDAGAGYDSYLWEDNSTDRMLTVDSTGWYTVTVTQGTLCANSDSVHVSIIIPDIEIDRLHNPVSSCSLTSTESLEVYVKNSGSDTLAVGDTIAFTYQFDGGAAEYDTLFVGQIVLPGDSILFQFQEVFDLSGIATYDFVMDATYSKDLIPGNNGFNQIVQVFGYPSVSLGPDQVSYTKEFILDAGPGYFSYLWQDGSGDRYYTVDYDDQTPNNTYTITVFNEYGCPDSDDIVVTFEDITDIGIDSLVHPWNSCDLTNLESLIVHIRNIGTVTLVNKQIQVGASINGGAITTEQILITQSFEGNEIIQYTFIKKFNFLPKGEYNIRVFTTFAEDDDTSNDTLKITISHFENPVVDLGGLNDTIRTTLPYLLDAGADFPSYVWNGQEGTRTFNATNAGWYTLVVVDENGCIASDSVFIVNITAVQDLGAWKDNLRIFPNPVSDLLHIELEIPEPGDYSLEIINGIGQKVFIREYKAVNRITETIDVSGVANGFYFLKIRTGNQQEFRKIVVQ